MKQWLALLLLIVMISVVLPLSACKSGGSADFNKPERPTPYPSGWKDQHIGGRD